jgi:hypothetical protein
LQRIEHARDPTLLYPGRVISRARAQSVARVGALCFVVLWLFSDRLQTAIPFWLPFAILAATEIEFVARGILEQRHGVDPAPASRRLPGADDADLGWVETVDEEGEPVLLPAPPRPPRRSRLPVIVVVVVGIALFAYAYRVDRNAGWPSVSAAHQAQAERLFTAESARIAGHAVTVQCDDGYAYTGVGSDAAGVAFISRRLAFLQPTICRSLYRIAFEHKVGARDDAAFAITVLAHEATHLRGIRNEAETECYALQEGVELGRRLGLDAATARDLMRAQRDFDLSDASVQRLDYRLPDGCRDGGSLDLRPDDPSFP